MRRRKDKPLDIPWKPSGWCEDGSRFAILNRGKGALTMHMDANGRYAVRLGMVSSSFEIHISAVNRRSAGEAMQGMMKVMDKVGRILNANRKALNRYIEEPERNG